MKVLFAASCVVICCMGNLPVPDQCRPQLLNVQNPSIHLQGGLNGHL